MIWSDYDATLHPWILKLTEAFDLTFPVPDQNMNLVPCLLPEDEPEVCDEQRDASGNSIGDSLLSTPWTEPSPESEDRELKIVYTFNYLPG